MLGLAAVAVIWGLIQYQDVVQSLLVVSGVSLLGYVLYESFKLPQGAARPDVRGPVPDRRSIPVLGLVRAGGLVDQPVHRPLSSTAAECRRRIFQSINPIYIILLAPLFAVLWVARPGAGASLGAGQVRPRLAAARRSATWCWSGARNAVGHRRAMTPVILVFLYYLFQTTASSACRRSACRR